MSLRRIYAVILKYMYQFIRSFDRISEVFFWPVVDLLLWGITSKYFESVSDEVPQIVVMISAAILFWTIIRQSQYNVNINLLHELWDRNLINIFSSPLQLREWLAGVMLVGLIKAVISFIIASTFAGVLYGFNIIDYVWQLLPFLFLLFLSGWAIGFLIAGITFRYGS